MEFSAQVSWLIVPGLMAVAYLGLTAPASAQACDASPFVAALVADGPAPELEEAAGVYDWLVGTWDVEVIDYPADGGRRNSRGVWHFGWVLAGRAMQDVWVSPPLRYGSSIRVWDEELGAWRVTWINPVTRTEDRLIGRWDGDRVVQEGERPDGSLIRWSFVDIVDNSFTWLGERSTDGGANWRLEAEFHACRVTERAQC
jgi:hypothetical protein